MSTGATTEYAGNFIYEDGELKFFSHPEGYTQPDQYVKFFDYVYQYKDHLGNIRLSYKDVGTTSTPILEIIEENNYYPFGLQHKGYNGNITSTNVGQDWRFQGQEYSDDLGINVYEFRYRMHDPAIGRFWQVDPLAEEYSYQSPYNFAENRVIDGIELEGLEWESIHNDEGEVTGYKWLGYNDDGTPKGGVGDAALVYQDSKGNQKVWHLTTRENDDGTRSAAMQILTANEDGMIEMPLSGTTFTSYNRNDERINGDTETDGFGTPENVANFINLAGQYEAEFRGDRLEFGDLSTSSGNSPRYTTRSGKIKRHGTHYNGSQADIRYINASGNTILGRGDASAGLSDPSRVQTLVNIANRLGMDHIHLGTALKNKIKGKGVNFNSGHNNHIHIGKGNGKNQ